MVRKIRYQPRADFVAMFEEIVNKNNEHTFLDKQICVHEHYNFIPIVQSLFNCFAKNQLKRINQCAVDHPATMCRGLHKLSSKSRPKH